MIGRREPEKATFFKTPTGKKTGILLIFLILSGIFFSWFRNILLAIIISTCMTIYITDIFNSRERTKICNLHKQLIGFLEHMIIMLRSGKTIRYIFINSWCRFPQPLKSYLKDVSERLEINPDLDHALSIFENKSGSREVKLIIAGIKINSRIGGDLIILLESISITLRESLRANSRMSNLTLQSRLSANIISFFPIASLLLLYVFYSSSILNFFSTAAGTVVLVAGGILEIAGIIFMKKIIRE